ncbi:MAG: hypothetical protein ACKOA2_06590 [Ilumatobacteraceae bacterium]
MTNPTRRGIDHEILEPGDDLTFGRQGHGVGWLGTDSRISRHHGTIHATIDGLAVSATGTMNGFVVRDRATPSRLHIPARIGPVPIPFRECSIVLEHCVGMPPYLDVLVEGSEGADRWHRSWGPEIRRKWRKPNMSTAPPIPHFDPKFANGRVRAWFLTLVALCEPQFGRGPAGVPTNIELAARRYVNTGVIERDLTQIYRALGIEHDPQRRDLAATLPVLIGAVTPADLDLLP